MKYGCVITALESGLKCARKGWNGKGMFIYLTTWTIIPTTNLKEETKNHLFGDKLLVDGSTVKFNSHIDMKTADGSITVGWIPSQADQLADDWEVVE